MITTLTQVQHALNVLGYKGVNGLPLVEDGINGQNTMYAVGKFQSDHPPLVVDQSAGPLTKAALDVTIAMANVSSAATPPGMAGAGAAPFAQPPSTPAAVRAAVAQVTSAVAPAARAASQKIASASGTPGKPVSTPVKLGLWAAGLGAVAVIAKKTGALRRFGVK
jgi:hypothetical protein